MKRVALLALLCTSPAAAQVVGVNALVVNDVRMGMNGVLRPAVVKQRVSLGDDLVTGKASRLQVLLLDRTSLTLGANARVHVDRFVFDPDRKASAVGVTVKRGIFRLMSGKWTRALPGRSGIQTPAAVVGIRGTIVEGAVGLEAIAVMAEQRNVAGYNADPETASLIVLRGPGEGIAGTDPGAITVTSGGVTVTIDQPGTAAFVPAEGRPPIVFRLWNCGAILFAGMLRNPRHRMQQAERDDTRFAAPLRQMPMPQLPPRI